MCVYVCVVVIFAADNQTPADAIDPTDFIDSIHSFKTKTTTTHRPTPRWVPALLVPRFWLMTAMASQKFRPDASKGAAAASS